MLSFPSDMDTLQLVGGRFVQCIDICVQHAKKTYLQRRGKDTHPMIVQMIHLGKPIPHWYYRSDQWIDQPYYKPSEFLQPYVGPIEFANPGSYGKGTYVPDKEITDFIDRTNSF